MALDRDTYRSTIQPLTPVMGTCAHCRLAIARTNNGPEHYPFDHEVYAGSADPIL